MKSPLTTWKSRNSHISPHFPLDWDFPKGALKTEFVEKKKGGTKSGESLKSKKGVSFGNNIHSVWGSLKFFMIFICGCCFFPLVGLISFCCELFSYRKSLQQAQCKLLQNPNFPGWLLLDDSCERSVVYDGSESVYSLSFFSFWRLH